MRVIFSRYVLFYFNMLICVNLPTKHVIDHTWLKQRVSVLNTLKQKIVCHWLLQQLNMHIKCVFGHTKRVELACCEHVITFVLEIIWRVTYYICCSLHLLCTSNSHFPLPCLNIPSLSMNWLPQFANYYMKHITLTRTSLSTHYNNKSLH